MIYYGCFPRGRRNKDKDKERTNKMEIKEFKVGTNVMLNGKPEVV